MRAGLVLALLFSGSMTALAATDPHREPVKEIADQRLSVTVTQGGGEVPVYVSQDWSQPQPGITRAVIVFHGLLRNADVYYADAKAALAQAGAAGAGTLLVVPQFLSDEDAAGYHLPPAMLHWGWDSWAGGEAAHGPVPASTFDAIDAVLARLADKRLFPNLRTVVVAGHSAGGQVVQRYAVVVKGEAPLLQRGIHLRYVVANPSSYLYFSPDRPDGNAAACPSYNEWKYGFAAGVPAYVSSAPAVLEKAYAARDVTYLLGGGGYRSEPSAARQVLRGGDAGAVSVGPRACIFRRDAGARWGSSEPAAVGGSGRRP